MTGAAGGSSGCAAIGTDSQGGGSLAMAGAAGGSRGCAAIGKLSCLQKKTTFLISRAVSSVLFQCSLLSTAYFDQISGQNKSEAREPEGLVKITYGIVHCVL